MKPFIFPLRVLCPLVCLLLTGSLSAQNTVSVTFRVDLRLAAEKQVFNYETDRVLVRGYFNSWDDQTPLSREGTTSIYSVTIPMNRNSWTEYKYFITSPGAENSGWETTNAGVGSGGNRPLGIRTNDLILPVAYFNNADMSLALSTEHFNFMVTGQDLPILPEYSANVESSFATIAGSLQATIGEKITIRMYPDLDHLHLATGNPEASANSLGSALTNTLIVLVSPGTPGTTGYNDLVGLIDHELTHCMIAWKTSLILPIWLNEGVACWFGHNASTKGWVVYQIDQLGHMPGLTEIENSDFGSFGGYAFSCTIAEFIVMTQGTDKLAQFVEFFRYTDLGYTDQAAFESAWHQYLRDHYIGHTYTGEGHSYAFGLKQNYPNPVSAETTIDFTIETPNSTLLTVVDITGKTMKTLFHEFLMPGHYSRTIPLNDLPGGFYYFRLISGPKTETCRMIKL